MPMSRAEFSLLLPVYAGDDPAHLRLAYESSTRNQTLRPAEAVIVQDGPVAEPLADELHRLETESVVPLRVIRQQENRGLTAALNRGLDAVETPVVARMDADDVSVPERFETQWPLIEEGYDLVGSGMAEFESDPEEIAAVRVPPVGEARIREHARTHNPFNHPTMMYRVEALDRVGRYEPFGKMEDYWLGIRLLQAGARVANVADPLVLYRTGSGAFSRRGGWEEARTELQLQREMLRMGFITRGQYLRNVGIKGTYRMLPAPVKRVLFRGLVAKGLPGDR